MERHEEMATRYRLGLQSLNANVLETFYEALRDFGAVFEVIKEPIVDVVENPPARDHHINRLVHPDIRARLLKATQTLSEEIEALQAMAPLEALHPALKDLVENDIPGLLLFLIDCPEWMAQAHALAAIRINIGNVLTSIGFLYPLLHREVELRNPKAETELYEWRAWARDFA